MRVTGLLGTKQVTINIIKYRINWDKAPSKGQQQLQNFLRPIWGNQIVLAEMRVPSSLLRCDIVNVNKKIVLEYSPESHHDNFNPFFHKNRVNYKNSIIRQTKKQEWAEKNGFTFIEIYESDLPLLSREFFREKFGVEL